MQINSLSVGVAARSLNSRNALNLNQQNVNSQTAIPRNRYFLPHKTKFERKAIPKRLKNFVVTKLSSLPNPFGRAKKAPQNLNKAATSAVLLYCNLRISREPTGLLVKHIKDKRLKTDVPSFIRQFKTKILNELHESRHVFQFIDALRMPDLRVYRERDENRDFLEKDGRIIL